MAIRIEWKPVLQALALKDYHPDYRDESISVCVNPKPDFWQERQDQQKEYFARYVETSKYVRSADTSPDVAERSAQAFLDWVEQEFMPKENGWFARLWSFGEEKFTADDLTQYNNVDPHFLVWLKKRSIEMVEEHRSARKKA